MYGGMRKKANKVITPEDARKSIVIHLTALKIRSVSIISLNFNQL